MYNIYIFIGMNENGGFAEPLQLFKLHPLGTIANFSSCNP